MNEHWIVIVSSLECKSLSFEDLQVRAGTSRKLRGGSVHRVDTVIEDTTRKNHATLGPNYDVMLMRVVEAFAFDETRRPIELYDADEPVLGKIANVTGFGWYSRDSDRMQTLEVPVIETDSCSRNDSKGLLQTRGLICTGYEEASDKEACYFEPGSPLVIDGRLAGLVTEFSTECHKPSFYTDVARFLEGINHFIDVYSIIEA